MNPREIIVVGGGAVGWSVAAALRSQLPRELATIQLVEDSRKDKNLVECSNSKIHRFHELIGLSEKVCAMDSYTQFGLGRAYHNWSYDLQRYILAEAPYGAPFKNIDFQHVFVKNHNAHQQESFADYSLNAVAAQLGRFGHPSQDTQSIYSAIKYGLHLQLESYATILKTHALSLGVKVVVADCAVVRRDDQNHIAALDLTNGETLIGDMFFDCTGEEGVLMRSLGVSYQQDKADSLFNKLATGQRPKTDSLPSVATLTTTDYGFYKIVPLKDREIISYYFSDQVSSDADIRKSLIELDFSSIEIADFNAYCAQDFWVNNCVAIGNSASQFSDIFISPLHLVRNSIVRFLDLLIDFDKIEASRDEYNKLTHAEFSHIKDVIELHLYVAKDHSTVMAEYFSGYSLSIGAAHRINLFKANGRHPQHDSGFLMNAEWAAFFLGNKVVPATCDYDVNFLNANDIQEYLRKLKESILEYAKKIPKYADYTVGLLK